MKTISLFIAVLAGLASVASGSAHRTVQWVQPSAVASGPLSNATNQPQEKVVGLLQAPAASRVRVEVTRAALGRASKVRFVSVKDGQSQTLDQAQLEMWSWKSALFNGDTVRLEVILAPGDRDVSIEVKQILAFSDEPVSGGAAAPDRRDPIPETLCGDDNRVATNDNRAGRLFNATSCTGWLVSNGAMLTAGHCLTAPGDILEVNVPASTPAGILVASAVQDQFPVLAGTITSVNAGIGNDWSVCRLGPNNLNQSAHGLHGFFRMTRELPAQLATTRVSGCGIDTTPAGTTGGANAQTQTQQTATGPFDVEIGSGGSISLQYAVDTEPANSGSPVIWEANGFTIGIHTAGGCTASGGSNAGTSFELDALEIAIAGVPGPVGAYLDLVKAPGGRENGSVFEPWDTLGEAVNAIPVNGLMSIVTGNYSAAGTTVTKPMTMIAPVGPVTLGN